MNLVKIENEPGLAKDTTTKAVVNLDERGLSSYLAQRNRLKENREKINVYECQLKQLIGEVCELKDAIAKILKNGNK